MIFINYCSLLSFTWRRLKMICRGWRLLSSPSQLPVWILLLTEAWRIIFVRDLKYLMRPPRAPLGSFTPPFVGPYPSATCGYGLLSFHASHYVPASSSHTEFPLLTAGYITDFPLLTSSFVSCCLSERQLNGNTRVLYYGYTGNAVYYRFFYLYWVRYVQSTVVTL